MRSALKIGPHHDSYPLDPDYEFIDSMESIVAADGGSKSRAQTNRALVCTERRPVLLQARFAAGPFCCRPVLLQGCYTTRSLAPERKHHREHESMTSAVRPEVPTWKRPWNRWCPRWALTVASLEAKANRSRSREQKGCTPAPFNTWGSCVWPRTAPIAYNGVPSRRARLFGVRTQSDNLPLPTH